MSLTFDARDLVGLPPADRTQCELAEADQVFHTLFGRDETAWLPLQAAAYERHMTALRTADPVALVEGGAA